MQGRKDRVCAIQSNSCSYLNKESSKSDSLLKTQIIDFVKENYYKERIHFYRYTSNTKYFIENEEENTGGFSQNALYDYPEDDMAVFEISECKKDSTKLVGELYFYGNAGFSSKVEIDTLIYHCK